MNVLTRVALLCMLLLPPVAQGGRPEVRSIIPPGGQRGASFTLTLHGERLADAAELLCYRPGLTVHSLKAGDEKKVELQVSLAADAPLGEHQIRLRTLSGISELRNFWVGPYPTVEEVEPNSDFEKPQVVPLGSTVSGIVTTEDVDYYAIDAQAGTRISVEIEAMRLGRNMFDTAVAILDARRFELAQNDDSTLLLQDSVASIVAPEDGRYYVRVRDASYGGCQYCRYRLHIGTHPRPVYAWPPGGTPSATSQPVTLHGDPRGPLQMVSEPSGPGLQRIFAEDADGQAPTAVLRRLSEMPSFDSATPPSEAPPVPVAYHGVIGKPGEVDRLRWQMKNGQAYVVDVFARRLRSPLDPTMRISREGGQNSVNNDDAVGLDARLQFTAAADGVGLVALRDRLLRGGDEYVYRAEITAAGPSLRIGLPLLNSRAHQYRQTLSVPIANRNAILVRVVRENVGGAVTLELPELPPGLEVELPDIPGDTDQTPLLLRASAEAEPLGALLPLHGRIGEQVSGQLRQDVPLVIAPPNQTVYYRTQVDRLAVAITQPAPFRLTVEQPQVPIVRGGSMRLPIRVERAEGFDGEIECRMLWNPPGFSAAGTIKIGKGQTEATYPIQARGNAPLATRPVCIIARGNSGRGEVWASSELIPVTVAEPFVSGAIQMAAVTQGEETSVTVKLEQRRPFDGKGTLRLLNLPARTSCEPVEMDATSEQAVFAVKAEKDAPPNTARNLFCQLVIQQDGHPITHLFGSGGTLRVDKPRPVEAKKPEAVAKAPEKKPAPKAAPKPLSRLEQLREKARRQREGKE